MRRPVLLSADPSAPFPPVEFALREPDGLLAVGGDLSPQRLLNAYGHGVFPWFSAGQPILWWSPDPRVVFDTAALHPAPRMRRTLRKLPWQVTADVAFERVLDACATTPRPGQGGTWITDEMRAAYVALHRLGHAHSIEVRDGARLVGGLYGVALGRMFFGESMFSAESGGSKVALYALGHRLRAWGWPLIDAQVENAHLMALGARRIPRARFCNEVAQLASADGPPEQWTARFGELTAIELSAPA